MNRRPGQTRITGGTFRGRTLAIPPGVRPTESRVREALFSIWRGRVRGARFLDLFAGSGAVGLEALSRGAASVQFVEASRRVAGVIQANAVRLGGSDWQLLRATLPGVLERFEGSHFDLVFADPPYDFKGYEQVIAETAGLLDPHGALAVEHSVRVSLPQQVERLELRDQRIYGESAVTIYEF